ncbi:hypothetical protein Pmani_029124 [Petrolisthes manimaculis]|uniref:Uncharacterized protein n=1 Tax=Petrolisthes manimaculis TaxID=1843537 RepID=A0AAE1P0N1_9EUCA|nr:hypothetical protein Pmani_029124 [Petrolisthes manimaculis]
MTHITKESYKMSGDESIATLIKHFFVHFSMLFRTRKMLQLTLCSNVGLLVTALGYQSISLSSAIYSSDPYIYSTLAGVVEIPGATLTIPFVNTFGRRPSNIVCMSTTGIFILAIAFIPKNMGWLIMLLALIGKMTISAAYQITYLHVSEVFPTEVRTRGAGLGDMMTKVGSIAAPFIIDSLRRNTTSYQVKKSTPEYHHITAHQDLSRHCQAIRILNNNEKIPRRMQNSRQVPQVNTVKKKNASQTLLGISW